MSQPGDILTNQQTICTTDLTRVLILVCLVIAAFYRTDAVAQDSSQDDNKNEASSAQNEDEDRFGNFLALPIFITEPAIGEGLGLGLVYFHKTEKDSTSPLSTPSSIGKTGQKQKPPPTATGVFGFYTSNQTQGFGLGHAGTYLDDRLRVVDLPFNFSLDGDLVYANFKRRLGTSNVFLGMSMMNLDADVDFLIDPNNPPPRSLLDFSFRNFGLAGSAIFDTRDDSMMPGQGKLYDLTVWRYDDAIGSDFDYWSARFKANSFHQLGDRWHLGLRLDISTVEGDPPFFAIPYISIRGIPALRYQAKTAGVVEVEGRYNISPRWAAIAFAGGGFTNSEDPTLDTLDDIHAFGAGLRFQAIREQNVWVGLDIAKGPEEYAWYIQVGHPW
jgi:hypothetical protein